MKKCFSAATSLFLLTLVSCGEKNSSTRELSMQSFYQTEKGIYEANLEPLNAHLGGEAKGRALVKLIGDEMKVEIQVNGSESQIVHAQFLQHGESCPTLSSDTNNDGVIDDSEGRLSYGPALIPLDQNLAVQVEEGDQFPRADFSGNYSYRAGTSWIKMMSDLLLKDLAPSDGLIKLKSALFLAGKPIVIKGISKDVKLPDTVRSIDQLAPHEALPIACGSLIKIANGEDSYDTNGGKD